ncbi:MAG: L,D-transpeptidase family protein [Acetivibrionales bacterium]
MSAAQITVDYVYEKSVESDEASDVIKKFDYYIFVEIEEHTLYLLQDNKIVKKYPIASGKPHTPSPIGSWKVITKGDWGGGFGGRWMGLNVPWGTYGIHGTNRPETIGWAASHGCIRMRNRDVEELYRLISHGTPVVISNGQLGPFGRGFRNISPGDRGADVFVVQRRLKELGFYKGYIDGIYGEGMKSAVHSFQRKNGLTPRNIIGRQELHIMGFREFE